ncbi:MAG: zf-HC2 domain-containing protein [Gaiellaceae bacterium]
MRVIERIWFGSCHETAELMSRHLEDDLAGLRRSRVRRHLDGCAACQALLRSLSRVVHELRSLRHEGFPLPSVAHAVMLRIRHDELGAR